MSRPVLTLGRPSIVRRTGSIDIRCPLHPGPGLWVRIDGPAALVARVVPAVEPFLPVALLAAGLEGADLVIDGPADPVHLGNLRANLVPLLDHTFGFGPIGLRSTGPPERAATNGASRRRTRPGRRGLRAARPDHRRPDPPDRSLALAFSAGIDSLYALRQLAAQGHPPTLLVNANAGAHGADRRLWARRLARIALAARELDLPLVRMDTDLHERVRSPHEQVHVFRNLAALGMLHGAVAAAAYSSTYPYPAVRLDRAPIDPDHLGPVAAAALAWAGLPVVEVGDALTRVEKSRAVADDPLAWRHLDVCVDAAHQVSVATGAPVNCGRCFKCTRALVTFDRLGVLDRFARAFDVPAYGRDAAAALERVRVRDGVADREILALVAATDGRPADGRPAGSGSQPTDERGRPVVPATADAWRPSRAELVLGPPIVARSSGHLHVRCSLGADRDLWVTLDGDPALVDRAVPSAEPFVPMALLVGASEGADVRVATDVDPVLLLTLRTSLLPLLTYALGAGDIRLRDALGDVPRRRTLASLRGARRPALEAPLPGSVAVPFSGGTDSFHTLGRLRELGLEPACLVNVNAGAHGPDRRVFDARLARVCSIGAEIGLPVLSIDSNLHEVTRVEHARIHPLRNLAVMGVLRGIASAVVYAASFTYRSIRFADAPHRIDHLAQAGPAAIAWRALPVIEVGYEVSRVDKTRLIADDPVARRHLDVCVDGAWQAADDRARPVNCGRCFKCLRAIVTLDALGRLEAFADRFVLDPYRADPEAAVETLRRRGGVHDHEVMALLGREPPEPRRVR